MIIQKVKYSLFLLVSISLLFTATSSFPETKKDVPDLIKSNLTVIGAEILVKKEELKLIWIKLLTMGSEGRVESHFDDELLDVIEGVSDNLSEIITLLEYEAELIITIPHIMDKYKSFFSRLRIEKINNTKNLIKISQNYFNYVYSESKYKATLWAVGDPRKNIQSVLELLDKTVSLLQSLREKKLD